MKLRCDDGIVRRFCPSLPITIPTVAMGDVKTGRYGESYCEECEVTFGVHSTSVLKLTWRAHECVVPTKIDMSGPDGPLADGPDGYRQDYDRDPDDYDKAEDELRHLRLLPGEGLWRKVAKNALKTLETSRRCNYTRMHEQTDAAIEALRTALLHSPPGELLPTSIEDRSSEITFSDDEPAKECCCDRHHRNYGRCLQCPIHGQPPVVESAVLPFLGAGEYPEALATRSDGTVPGSVFQGAVDTANEKAYKPSAKGKRWRCQYGHSHTSNIGPTCWCGSHIIKEEEASNGKE